jgi:hypothetical protein
MTMRLTSASRIAAAGFATAALLLSLLLIPARSAERPSLLYATLPVTPLSQLAAFSLEANRGSVIGNIGFTLSAALTFCPPGKMAYTVTNIYGEPIIDGGTGLGPPQLATLNLGTGAAALVGSPLPLWEDPMALECSRSGILYTVAGSDPTNQFSEYNTLYTIDRTTGQLSRIGFTGVNDGTGDDAFMALRFAPDGTLYGVNPFALFTIDLNTGLATKVVDFTGDVSPGTVMGLAINSHGNFYIADFVPGSRIYLLDTTTGVTKAILNTRMGFVHSIAFRTPG